MKQTPSRGSVDEDLFLDDHIGNQSHAYKNRQEGDDREYPEDDQGNPQGDQPCNKQGF